MGRNVISIRDRINEYKSEQFYESDTNILMCNLCNRRLEWKKKYVLEKHIKSEGHQAAKKRFTEKSDEEKKAVKRQATVSGMIENQKKAKIEKTSFIHDTVNMCLESNIPLHKLDHPAVREYFAKYVPGSGDLPGASTLRSKYVPACGEEMKLKIKAALKDKSVVIVADETSDNKGRCVFAILFRTMTPTAEQEVYLASCSFLEKADGTTCSQSIIDCIKEYGIEYSNIIGFVSDSARYMGKCFQALQTIVGDNLLHFQCFAHKLNLVGDIFLKELHSLNLLVSKLKMAFLHSRKLRNKYLNFIKEKYPSLPSLLFPAPVITRWNSWFKAVQYLNTYVDVLVDFFNNLEDECHSSSTASVISMFQDRQSAAQLKIEISFVSEVSLKISALINTLEGSKYPYGHKIWDELKAVSSALDRYAHGYLPLETERLVKACTFINVTTKEKIKEQLRECMKKCSAKLAKHMERNKTNDCFMAASSLFDPTIAGQMLNLNLSSLEECKNKIPFFTCLSREEFFEGYEKFHAHLVTNIRNGCEVDCLQMLLALKLQHEKFSAAALKCLWTPTNSVDAERFFSRYNLIVTDCRNRMKEETVETCSMLSFNAAISVE